MATSDRYALRGTIQGAGSAFYTIGVVATMEYNDDHMNGDIYGCV